MTGQSTSESITPGAAAAARALAGNARRLSLVRGARPLKRWRYVGVFSEQLMACAALVQVGPARQSFWALLDRGTGELRERTRLLPRRGALVLSEGRSAAGAAGAAGAGPRQGRLLINDSGVALELSLAEDDGIQALCAHGRGQVWTRKQAGIAARGTLVLGGGPPRALQALAVIDDTAGYHARRTEWWWSAGVGEGPDGMPLAWNLVQGINDPPSGSERAVWIAGEPHETAPVSFASDLRRISCSDGSELLFQPEAERSRRENLLIFKSDYRAPFGAFSGVLPGGVALSGGIGVVEHHRAFW